MVLTFQKNKIRNFWIFRFGKESWQVSLSPAKHNPSHVTKPLWKIIRAAQWGSVSGSHEREGKKLNTGRTVFNPENGKNASLHLRHYFLWLSSCIWDESELFITQRLFVPYYQVNIQQEQWIFCSYPTNNLEACTYRLSWAVRRKWYWLVN